MGFGAVVDCDEVLLRLHADGGDVGADVHVYGTV